MKKLVLALLCITSAASLKAYSGTGSTMFNTPAITVSFNDTTYAALPLRLRLFTARFLSASRIELSWLTAETWATVTHYEIQRALGNGGFETIGTVLQTDNRPIDQYYRFIDEAAPLNQTHFYYRLKQVNRNGLVSYSFIVPVNRDAEEEGLSVWPVPVKSELHVSFNLAEAATVAVTVNELTGRQAARMQYNAEPGRNTVQPNISRLNAGVYIVQVWKNNQLIGAMKFTKTS